MVCTPAVVCTTIGNTDDMKMRNIGDASPTPNHRMAIGIQAIGENGAEYLKDRIERRKTRLLPIPSKDPAARQC